MQAGTWSISEFDKNLIKAVAICKILHVETTLGMTLERRKFNISR